MTRTGTGLDRLVERPELIGDAPWALLSNHAAVTAELDHARIRLPEVCRGPLVRLFAPEHGIDGVAQDMEGVDDVRDPATGLHVRSLYGRDESTLRPRPGDLDGVRRVVVDLPDIGTRHYTFAATLDLMMATCAAAGVEVAVLDRPDPIGGRLREGGLVEPGLRSFVSQLPTPVRHGLTLGEIALLLHRDRYPDLELTVVPCAAWRRDRWLDETGLPWVPPSPNMPTLGTAAVYPGMCLFEATNLSEGRGTTRPFRLVGAPWVEPERLVSDLRRLRPPGVAFRPARFRPQFQKHAGTVCGGVEVHVTDRRELRPVELGVEMLGVFRRHDPDRFGWRSEPYEFVSDVPAIDLLTGSARVREVIEGDGDLDPVLSRWEHEVRRFEEALEGVLLYR